RQILKTHLNGRNLMKAINTYAVPLLTYSFGIIKWSKTDIENLNIAVRTLFSKFRKHHPKSSIERFSLPRENGGRGFFHLQNLKNKQINLMRKYFLQNKTNSHLIATITKADKNYTPLNLSNDTITLPILTPNAIINTIKQKTLHGRFMNEVEQPGLDVKLSHKWLRSDILPETEGFMFAIQDQVIKTRNYLKHIIKNPSTENDKCRMCKSKSETIQHLISSCSALVSSKYKDRHDTVAKIIHSQLAHICGFTSTVPPHYA